MIIMIFCTLLHFIDQKHDVEFGEEEQALVHDDDPIKGYYTDTCIIGFKYIIYSINIINKTRHFYIFSILKTRQI